MNSQDDESNLTSLDLYTDLLTDDLTEKKENFDELHEKHNEAQSQISELEEKLKSAQEKEELLEKQNKILQQNISALLATAKTEIQRKDAAIKELRHSVDRQSVRTILNNRCYQRSDSHRSSDSPRTSKDTRNEKDKRTRLEFGESSSRHGNFTKDRDKINSSERRQQALEKEGRDEHGSLHKRDNRKMDSEPVHQYRGESSERLEQSYRYDKHNDSTKARDKDEKDMEVGRDGQRDIRSYVKSKRRSRFDSGNSSSREREIVKNSVWSSRENRTQDWKESSPHSKSHAVRLKNNGHYESKFESSPSAKNSFKRKFERSESTYSDRSDYSHTSQAEDQTTNYSKQDDLSKIDDATMDSCIVKNKVGSVGVSRDQKQTDDSALYSAGHMKRMRKDSSASDSDTVDRGRRAKKHKKERHSSDHHSKKKHKHKSHHKKHRHKKHRHRSKSQEREADAKRPSKFDHVDTSTYEETEPSVSENSLLKKNSGDSVINDSALDGADRINTAQLSNEVSVPSGMAALRPCPMKQNSSEGEKTMSFFNIVTNKGSSESLMNDSSATLNKIEAVDEQSAADVDYNVDGAVLYVLDEASVSQMNDSQVDANPSLKKDFSGLSGINNTSSDVGHLSYDPEVETPKSNAHIMANNDSSSERNAVSGGADNSNAPLSMLESKSTFASVSLLSGRSVEETVIQNTVDDIHLENLESKDVQKQKTDTNQSNSSGNCPVSKFVENNSPHNDVLVESGQVMDYSIQVSSIQNKTHELVPKQKQLGVEGGSEGNTFVQDGLTKSGHDIEPDSIKKVFANNHLQNREPQEHLVSTRFEQVDFTKNEELQTKICPQEKIILDQDLQMGEELRTSKSENENTILGMGRKSADNNGVENVTVKPVETSFRSSSIEATNPLVEGGEVHYNGITGEIHNEYSNMLEHNADRNTFKQPKPRKYKNRENGQQEREGRQQNQNLDHTDSVNTRYESNMEAQMKNFGNSFSPCCDKQHGENDLSKVYVQTEDKSTLPCDVSYDVSSEMTSNVDFMNEYSTDKQRDEHIQNSQYVPDDFNEITKDSVNKFNHQIEKKSPVINENERESVTASHVELLKTDFSTLTASSVEDSTNESYPVRTSTNKRSRRRYSSGSDGDRPGRKLKKKTRWDSEDSKSINSTETSEKISVQCKEPKKVSESQRECSNAVELPSFDLSTGRHNVEISGKRTRWDIKDSTSIHSAETSGKISIQYNKLEKGLESERECSNAVELPSFYSGSDRRKVGISEKQTQSSKVSSLCANIDSQSAHTNNPLSLGMKNVDFGDNYVVERPCHLEKSTKLSELYPSKLGETNSITCFAEPEDSEERSKATESSRTQHEVNQKFAPAVAINQHHSVSSDLTDVATEKNRVASFASEVRIQDEIESQKDGFDNKPSSTEHNKNNISLPHNYKCSVLKDTSMETFTIPAGKSELGKKKEISMNKLNNGDVSISCSVERNILESHFRNDEGCLRNEADMPLIEATPVNPIILHKTIVCSDPVQSAYQNDLDDNSEYSSPSILLNIEKNKASSKPLVARIIPENNAPTLVEEGNDQVTETTQEPTLTFVVPIHNTSHTKQNFLFETSDKETIQLSVNLKVKEEDDEESDVDITGDSDSSSSDEFSIDELNTFSSARTRPRLPRSDSTDSDIDVVSDGKEDYKTLVERSNSYIARCKQKESENKSISNTPVTYPNTRLGDGHQSQLTVLQDVSVVFSASKNAENTIVCKNISDKGGETEIQHQDKNIDGRDKMREKTLEGSMSAVSYSPTYECEKPVRSDISSTLCRDPPTDELIGQMMERDSAGENVPSDVHLKQSYSVVSKTKQDMYSNDICNLISEGRTHEIHPSHSDVMIYSEQTNTAITDAEYKLSLITGVPNEIESNNNKGMYPDADMSNIPGSQIISNNELNNTTTAGIESKLSSVTGVLNESENNNKNMYPNAGMSNIPGSHIISNNEQNNTPITDIESKLSSVIGAVNEIKNSSKNICADAVVTNVPEGQNISKNEQNNTIADIDSKLTSVTSVLNESENNNKNMCRDSDMTNIPGSHNISDNENAVSPREERSDDYSSSEDDSDDYYSSSSDETDSGMIISKKETSNTATMEAQNLSDVCTTGHSKTPSLECEDVITSSPTNMSREIFGESEISDSDEETNTEIVCTKTNPSNIIGDKDCVSRQSVQQALQTYNTSTACTEKVNQVKKNVPTDKIESTYDFSLEPQNKSASVNDSQSVQLTLQNDNTSIACPGENYQVKRHLQTCEIERTCHDSSLEPKNVPHSDIKASVDDGDNEESKQAPKHISGSLSLHHPHNKVADKNEEHLDNSNQVNNSKNSSLMDSEDSETSDSSESSHSDESEDSSQSETSSSDSEESPSDGDSSESDDEVSSKPYTSEQICSNDNATGYSPQNQDVSTNNQNSVNAASDIQHSENKDKSNFDVNQQECETFEANIVRSNENDITTNGLRTNNETTVTEYRDDNAGAFKCLKSQTEEIIPDKMGNGFVENEQCGTEYTMKDQQYTLLKGAGASTVSSRTCSMEHLNEDAQMGDGGFVNVNEATLPSSIGDALQLLSGNSASSSDSRSTSFSTDSQYSTSQYTGTEQENSNDSHSSQNLRSNSALTSENFILANENDLTHHGVNMRSSDSNHVVQDTIQVKSNIQVSNENEENTDKKENIVEVNATSLSEHNLLKFPLDSIQTHDNSSLFKSPDLLNKNDKNKAEMPNCKFKRYPSTSSVDGFVFNMDNEMNIFDESLQGLEDTVSSNTIRKMNDLRDRRSMEEGEILSDSNDVTSPCKRVKSNSKLTFNLKENSLCTSPLNYLTHYKSETEGIKSQKNNLQDELKSNVSGIHNMYKIDFVRGSYNPDVKDTYHHSLGQAGRSRVSSSGIRYSNEDKHTPKRCTDRGKKSSRYSDEDPLTPTRNTKRRERKKRYFEVDRPSPTRKSNRDERKRRYSEEDKLTQSRSTNRGERRRIQSEEDRLTQTRSANRDERRRRQSEEDKLTQTRISNKDERRRRHSDEQRHHATHSTDRKERRRRSPSVDRYRSRKVTDRRRERRSGYSDDSRKPSDHENKSSRSRHHTYVKDVHTKSINTENKQSSFSSRAHSPNKSSVSEHTCRLKEQNQSSSQSQGKDSEKQEIDLSHHMSKLRSKTNSDEGSIPQHIVAKNDQVTNEASNCWDISPKLLPPYSKKTPPKIQIMLQRDSFREHRMENEQCLTKIDNMSQSVIHEDLNKSTLCSSNEKLFHSSKDENVKQTLSCNSEKERIDLGGDRTAKQNDPINLVSACASSGKEESFERTQASHSHTKSPKNLSHADDVITQQSNQNDITNKLSTSEMNEHSQNNDLITHKDVHYVNSNKKEEQTIKDQSVRKCRPSICYIESQEESSEKMPSPSALACQDKHLLNKKNTRKKMKSCSDVEKMRSTKERTHKKKRKKSLTSENREKISHLEIPHEMLTSSTISNSDMAQSCSSGETKPPSTSYLMPSTETQDVISVKATDVKKIPNMKTVNRDHELVSPNSSAPSVLTPCSQPSSSSLGLISDSQNLMPSHASELEVQYFSNMKSNETPSANVVSDAQVPCVASQTNTKQEKQYRKDKENNPKQNNLQTVSTPPVSKQKHKSSKKDKKGKHRNKDKNDSTQPVE